MKVLVVKTSSIGDVIHTLPALTDARRALPDIAFDWVIEEELAPIGLWHPAVAHVIPVAYRRWRRRPVAGLIGGALGAFRRRLRARRYDAVIDAQGLYKSGVVTALSDGPKHGYDLASCREKLAPLAYDRRYAVPRAQHAILRTRSLFAQVLGYKTPETAPDYGLAREQFAASGLAGPYVVFLHGTKWRTKRWAPDRWRSLGLLANEAGFRVYVPWLGEGERQRAQAIADAVPGAELLPPVSLERAASVLAGASGVVAVDTGLAHLAAALSVPEVTLYGATSPARTGTMGATQEHMIGAMPCVPCRNKICNYTGNAHGDAPCLADLPAEAVWRVLSGAMRAASG